MAMHPYQGDVLLCQCLTGKAQRLTVFQHNAEFTVNMPGFHKAVGVGVNPRLDPE